MSWVAVLLLSVGWLDICRALCRRPVVLALIAVATPILVGLTAGLHAPRDLVALVVIAAVTLAWCLTSGTPDRYGAAVPLALLVSAVTVFLVLTPATHPVAGPFASWVRRSDAPVVGGADPTHVLLLVAVVLVQLSTGNTIVRLVLALTGGDDSVAGADRPSEELRGGRLLGPMERVFILGLGVAGHVTAATIVVAAKGLLRFPELQAKRRASGGSGEDQVTEIHGAGIDKVTEYFLVGSFLSWLVALAGVVLLS